MTLDASGSHDPEHDPLTYQWTQIAGPTVVLTLTDPVHPTFVAPLVGRTGLLLIFQLTVSDGLAESLAADVTITVLGEGRGEGPCRARPTRGPLSPLKPSSGR